MIGYDYVGLTITFTVIGQLLSKWQMGSLTMPEGTITKLNFFSSRPVPPDRAISAQNKAYAGLKTAISHT